MEKNGTLRFGEGEDGASLATEFLDVDVECDRVDRFQNVTVIKIGVDLVVRNMAGKMEIYGILLKPLRTHWRLLSHGRPAMESIGSSVMTLSMKYRQKYHMER